MKSSLYICNTYYHLLISIVKAIKSEEPCSVVLSADRKNDCLFHDDKLVERLEKSKIFKEVLIFNNSEYETKIDSNKLKKYLYTIRCAKKDELNLKKYDNIYIFYELCSIGRMLNFLKLKYNLIEDGTDFFIRNSHRLIIKKGLKEKIKEKLNFYSFANSKYINSIEVNSTKGLENYKKNFVEVPRDELFNSLTNSEKNKILRIFLPDGLDNNDFEKSSLIITQPLSEDGILDSEKTKIEIYKKIITDVATSKKIIIKTHPREKTNYKKFFKECIIIDYPFPIELLSFFSIKIEEAITVSSTSVNLIKNCNHKIYLGWDYLKENKKKGINK